MSPKVEKPQVKHHSLAYYLALYEQRKTEEAAKQKMDAATGANNASEADQPVQDSSEAAERPSACPRVPEISPPSCRLLSPEKGAQKDDQYDHKTEVMINNVLSSYGADRYDFFASYMGALMKDAERDGRNVNNSVVQAIRLFRQSPKFS